MNASGSSPVTAWSVSGVPSVRVLPVCVDVDDDFGVDLTASAGGDGDERVGALLGEGRAPGRVGHHHLLVDHRADRAGLGGWQPGGEGDHAVGFGAPGRRAGVVLAGFDDVVVFVAVRPGGDRRAEPPGGGDRRELDERLDVVVGQVRHQDSGLGVGDVAVAHRGVQGRPVAQGAGDAHLGACGADLDVAHLGEPRRARQRTPGRPVRPGVELTDQDQQLVGARRELAGERHQLCFEPLDRAAPPRRPRSGCDAPAGASCASPAAARHVSTAWSWFR